MPKGCNNHHSREASLFLAVLIMALISFSGIRPPEKKTTTTFRVGFYNLENLYDWEDDPQCDDQQFLPNSPLAWSKERFEKKIKNLAVVIKKLAPDVLGVCEIENRKVLDYLITKTSLKKENYSVIHYESPDKRGIDVGLIYKKGRFSVVKTASYPVVFPGDMSKPTRDILYVKGRTNQGQELHFVVNHWPSRSGGAEKTEAKRILAAKTARRLCDSILFTNSKAHIAILGDFNDYPDDKSLSETLGAQADSAYTKSYFYNLMGWRRGSSRGSYHYQGNWGFLDQIIVSSSMVEEYANVRAFFKKADAVDFKFMLGPKKSAASGKPFPTYDSENYLGGYSDHLPVYADFTLTSIKK
jgi:predicted extracellular nuclease